MGISSTRDNDVNDVLPSKQFILIKVSNNDSNLMKQKLFFRIRTERMSFPDIIYCEEDEVQNTYYLSTFTKHLLG